MKVGESKDNINIATARGMFTVFESIKLMLYLYTTVTGLSNSHMNKDTNHFILFYFAIEA